MVRDEGWALPDEDRQRVLSALVYFADPKDMIPDSVPVLGYFDDAITIELCVRDLRHELDAYDEFCEFRQGEAERRGLEPAKVGRADWLEARRDELQDRMHRRRDARFRHRLRQQLRLRRQADQLPARWRPGMFAR